LEHDPRFASHELRTENRLALYEIVKRISLSKTLEEWKQCLSEAGIPFAPRQKLSEVINDPQAKANDYFVPFDHPTYGRIEVITNPIHLSETPATIRIPAPEFSQHTEEILLALGYTWADIAQFKEQGVIA
jgi:crotonobetainyl-CoA:carnitine CoA-transferase CaiB-like acyl-CoA transferase